MDMVRMYHPAIDGGKRVIERPASAVPQHLMAGWLVSDEATLEEIAVQLLVDGGMPRDQAERLVRKEPPSEEKASEAPANAGASALEEPPRRRRAVKEGE